MKDVGRSVSLGLFVLILLCFMLPFARISCGEAQVVKATGYEVAFGKTIPAQTDSTGGRPRWNERAAEVDVVAIACLIAAVVGLGLSLVRGRRGAIARVILSYHGFLLLLALWGELAYRVRQNGAQLQMLAGYWAALALFVVACLANLPATRRGLRVGP